MTRRWRWLGAASGAAAIAIALAIAIVASERTEPSAPQRDGPATPVAHATATDAGPVCAHPYVPSAPGTVLEYEWTGPGRRHEITMTLASLRQGADGATLTWRVETRLDRGVETVSLDRDCGPRGAEEPWLGLGVPAGATLTPQTWRSPNDLAAGDRYSGAFGLTFLGHTLTIERAHDVHGPERVEISGRHHEALRVEIEDHPGPAAEPIRSTAWIAPSLGLLRLVTAVGTEGEARYELVAFRVPAPRPGAGSTPSE